MFSTNSNQDEVTTISSAHNLSEWKREPAENPSQILNLAPYHESCKLELNELYVDHEFKEDMVIGPTEFHRPTIIHEGLRQETNYSEPSIKDDQKALANIDQLAHCKVEIPDVRETLYCYQCGQWSLTEEDLLWHKTNHESTINGEQMLENECSTKDNEQCSTKDKELLLCKVVIPDIRNELYCYKCKEWSPTAVDLLCHTLKAHRFSYEVDENVFEQFQAENQQHLYPNANESKNYQNDKQIASTKIRGPNQIIDQSAFEKFESENQQILCYNDGNESQKENLYNKIISRAMSKRYNAKYPCDLCNKSLSSVWRLLIHKRLHETKPFSCEICGYLFSTEHACAIHELKHATGKPFCCNLCGKGHTSRIALENHKRTNHSNKHRVICANCGRDFKQKSNLVTHIQYCKGIPKNNQSIIQKTRLLCDLCGKCYQQKKYLIRHLQNGCGRKRKTKMNQKINNESISKSETEVQYIQKNRFVCNLCGKDYEKKGFLIRHFQNGCPRKRTTKLYPCDLCNKICTRNWCLDVHKRIHKRKPFACKICGKLFKNERDSTGHELKHAGIKPYQCDQCNKAFFSNWALKAHLIKHKKDKAYSCDTCKSSYKYEGNLKTHIKMVHSTFKDLEPQKFTCDKCDRTFTFRRDFVTHLNKHNRREKCFACEHCPKQFNRVKYLKYHIINQHPLRPLAFECDNCTKRFATKHTLANHKRAHDYKNYKIYQCDVCGKKFHSKKLQVVHTLRHQGIRNKQFSCETCGKEFEYASSLRRHKIIHTDDRPFPCDQCGKTFNLKTSLSSHKLSHTNIKPYVCEVCGSRHKTLGAKNSHMKFHNDNEHWCDHCGKQFTSKTSVVRHIFGYCVKSGQKKIPNKYSIKGYKRPPQIKLFSCEICGYSFTTERARANHELKHESDKLEKHSNCI